MATIDTTTVLNIAALKNYPVPANGIIVYVEGYHYNPTLTPPIPMDAGGGFFRYDANSMTEPDLGINFRPSSLGTNDSGRWVRQYEGYLDVAYFGIVKHPLFEAPSGEKNHERLQAAIDYCYKNSRDPYKIPPLPYVDSAPMGSFTIYFPAGAYWLQPDKSSIVLRSKTCIKGEDTAMIRLNYKTNIEYLFKIDKGSVKHLTIESLRFDLGAVFEIEGVPVVGNPTGFLHAKAEAPDPDPTDPTLDPSGGLFIANLRDLYVQNVGNHGIFFEGGQIDPANPEPNVPGSHLPPGAFKCNQWVYLDNVWMEKRYNNKNAFRLEGYNVNLTFTNCNPFTPLADYNTSNPTLLGAAFHLDSILPHLPANNTNIVFTGCDAGGAPNWPGQYGFYIRNSRNIVIEKGWIEDSEIGIHVENSKAISILDNLFANAAANGSLDSMVPERRSACIIVKDSFVTVERNYVDVTDPYAKYVENERFIMGLPDSNGITNNVINSSNNYFNHPVSSQTYGIVQPTLIQQVYSTYMKPLPTSPTLAGIDIDAKKVVFVSIGSGGSDIYRINSSLNTGELLYLRAETGDITFHQMGLPEYGGKNINLSFGSTVVLQHGHVATFVKMDNPNGSETSSYQLLSVY